MDYYGTFAGFGAYHIARGRDADFTSDEVNIALLVASEWLDGSFGYRWPGYKVGDRAQQTRDWLIHAFAESRMVLLQVGV